jgi:hypothetical protein
MGKIVKLDNAWSDKQMDMLVEKADAALDEDVLFVRDSEMEVFEYDELENVTIHVDEVEEAIMGETEEPMESLFMEA